MTPIVIAAWSVPAPPPVADRPPPPAPLELVLVAEPYGGAAVLLWRGAELLGELELEGGEA